jgi:hypothetical protein
VALGPGLSLHQWIAPRQCAEFSGLGTRRLWSCSTGLSNIKTLTNATIQQVAYRVISVVSVCAISEKSRAQQGIERFERSGKLNAPARRNHQRKPTALFSSAHALACSVSMLGCSVSVNSRTHSGRPFQTIGARNRLQQKRPIFRPARTQVSAQPTPATRMPCRGEPP